MIDPLVVATDHSNFRYLPEGFSGLLLMPNQGIKLQSGGKGETAMPTFVMLTRLNNAMPGSYD
jgi:hypothetical protein